MSRHSEYESRASEGARAPLSASEERFSPERLSGQLVRALRGERGQLALSKVLGFGSNVIYTWEAGRRHPEVSAFFRLGEASGIDVRRRLLEFLKEVPPELARASFRSPRTVQRLVVLLAGNQTAKNLGQALGADRTTVARWLKGRTEPRMPEFLRLVEATTHRTLEFVSLFTDPAELEATRAAYADLRSQRRLAYDLPWSHALLRALELDDYRTTPLHDDAWLGARVGLEPDAVRRYLSELSSAGQVRWTGTHFGVARVLTVDTRQDPVKNRQLKQHWAEVALERMRGAGTPQDALFSFNLFAISDDSFAKLRELHLDYFERVRALIEASPSADRVVLMNLQLVPLEQIRGGSDSRDSGKAGK